MNDRAFDAIARRAARALDRRSLLGLVTSAGLAAAAAPLPARADKSHHGGGGGGGKKDKKNDDKSCKRHAKRCRGLIVVFCANVYSADPLNFALCYDLYNQSCCIPLSKCQLADSICI